jgi:hypothetical protein
MQPYVLPTCCWFTSNEGKALPNKRVCWFYASPPQNPKLWAMTVTSSNHQTRSSHEGVHNLILYCCTGMRMPGMYDTILAVEVIFGHFVEWPMEFFGLFSRLTILNCIRKCLQIKRGNRCGTCVLTQQNLQRNFSFHKSRKGGCYSHLVLVRKSLCCQLLWSPNLSFSTEQCTYVPEFLITRTLKNRNT